MKNIAILLVVSPATKATPFIKAMEALVYGENLHVTICVVDAAQGGGEIDTLLDHLLALCDDRHVSLQIEYVKSNPTEAVSYFANTADLLIAQDGTYYQSLKDLLPEVLGCSVLILALDFKNWEEVVVLVDGDRRSFSSAKYFLQIFNKGLPEAKFTLITIDDAAQAAIQTREESMMIEYIRHFTRDLSVLKSSWPLPESVKKIFLNKSRAVVVGPINRLLTNETELGVFPGSSLFLAAQS